MTAIMGRLATYTGKIIKWDDAINSNVQLCNVDELKNMESKAPLYPDEQGQYWYPKPGREVNKTIDF